VRQNKRERGREREREREREKERQEKESKNIIYTYVWIILIICVHMYMCPCANMYIHISMCIYMCIHLWICIKIWNTQRSHICVHVYIDWCCFSYFVRNSLVTLLKAPCAHYIHKYVSYMGRPTRRSTCDPASTCSVSLEMRVMGKVVRTNPN